MRYLRKQGTMGPVFPYHESLAERGDMEVVDAPASEPKAEPEPEAKPKDELEAKADTKPARKGRKKHESD